MIFLFVKNNVYRLKIHIKNSKHSRFFTCWLHRSYTVIVLHYVVPFDILSGDTLCHWCLQVIYLPFRMLWFSQRVDKILSSYRYIKWCYAFCKIFKFCKFYKCALFSFCDLPLNLPCTAYIFTNLKFCIKFCARLLILI